ncbi:DUF1763-domain-containing protein [Lophium mytilinum]|uniref:DUF1763-domain-containing protein n=1 Tax=Lophium mytilinum TaxID=390894 RepID=A0A6A6QNZ7_9PEZI|nr:DUF1763-domain-containing protein [Lophium mytilinum]
MSSKIVHAYRHLYRHGLRAVQFSTPARYTLRDRLRLAFRTGDPLEFSQSKIDNTIEFLKGATRETGLEHRLLKSFLHVWFHQGRPRMPRNKNDADQNWTRYTAYDPWNHNIRMLNESMGMCLPMSQPPLLDY